MQITVRCRCGRVMTQAALLGPHHYRCGCGASVALSGLPDIRRCPIIRNGQMCLKPRHGELTCRPCSLGITRQALRDEGLCEQLATTEEGRRYAQEQQAALDKLKAEREAEQERIREEARLRDFNVVYYVKIRPGVVKIGTTRQLQSRMKALRVLRDDVLAAEPGTQLLENVRHRQFAHLRTGQYREDFTFDDSLAAHIAAIVAQHGNPYDLADEMAARAEEKARLLAQTLAQS